MNCLPTSLRTFMFLLIPLCPGFGYAQTYIPFSVFIMDKGHKPVNGVEVCIISSGYEKQKAKPGKQLGLYVAERVRAKDSVEVIIAHPQYDTLRIITLTDVAPHHISLYLLSTEDSYYYVSERKFPNGIPVPYKAYPRLLLINLSEQGKKDSAAVKKLLDKLELSKSSDAQIIFSDSLILTVKEYNEQFKHRASTILVYANINSDNLIRKQLKKLRSSPLVKEAGNIYRITPGYINGFSNTMTVKFRYGMGEKAIKKLLKELKLTSPFPPSYLYDYWQLKAPLDADISQINNICRPLIESGKTESVNIDFFNQKPAPH